MPSSRLDDSDLAQLRARGISLDEVQHQLLCFRNPPNYADLVRPCTVGDGIQTIPEGDHDDLLEIHRRAADAGRVTKFVPASGAATRMFRSLLRYLASDAGPRPPWSEVVALAGDGDGDAAELVRCTEEVERLPFFELLRDEVARDGVSLVDSASAGEYRPMIDAMLSPGGLALGDRPKGLIPFHRYDDGVRTALEEHIVEAAAIACESGGLCRAHFTVSPEHLDAFASRMREIGPRYVKSLGVAFDVSYSVQKSSTDTLAVDADDRPVRGNDGRLLFRPGGHGALIENLDDLGGDIVFVKNIDNVQRDPAKAVTHLWKKILAGHLARVQARAFDHLHRLKTGTRSDPEAIEDGFAFLRAEFSIEPPAALGDSTPDRRKAYLIERLDRPIRVCGVVRNTGEPGGGPFWVQDADGTVSVQIIESAQIDPDSDAHQQSLAGSTHFNPVDLVCGLRDAAGVPYALLPLIDADAVIVTSKAVDGREVKVLERPGLWNGAMAGWNTVLVEVPLETFTPVKTVVDLLRPEHQPQPV